MANVNVELKEILAKVVNYEKDLERLKVEKGEIDDDIKNHEECIEKKTANCKCTLLLIQNKMANVNAELKEILAKVVNVRKIFRK